MTGLPDPWDYVALLDALALHNVLALVRERPGEVQTYRDGDWRSLQKVSHAVERGHPWAKEPLSAEQAAAIMAQVGPPAPAPAADFNAAHQRIAQDLTAMRNTGRCRTVEFGHGVYAQWADYLEDGGLAVEVPGNAVLPKGRQLSPEDEAELVNRAAIPPHPGNPNWSWRFETIVLEPEIAAKFLLDVLVDAYHLDPENVFSAIITQVPPHGDAAESPAVTADGDALSETKTRRGYKQPRPTCIRKAQPSGDTSYYVLGTWQSDPHEWYWDAKTETWKDFPRQGMLWDRMCDDPDPEWVFITENDLPAPLPARHGG